MYIQFNALALGRLPPTIMAPQDFKSFLFSQTKLPKTIRLPGNLDIWSFYKFLTRMSTTENNKLLIIQLIPLLDAQNSYSIYKVHNLPALMLLRQIKVNPL